MLPAWGSLHKYSESVGFGEPLGWWLHGVGVESCTYGQGIRVQCPFPYTLPYTSFPYGCLPGAVMGGPARDEVMKKIPGRQGCPGPHPWRGHEEKTWQASPSRIRDPPGWPWPLPHPVSSPLFCCCSCLPCCGFLCCLLRALLLLFRWMRTNLKP